MAKFIITSGSHYTPFTYDELVKPIQQMTDAQNASQDVYDELDMQSQALRNYISDNPEDRQAKAMYDNYMTKLSTLQDNLWRNGYNSQTRRDLAAARAGYASDITRLQTAIQSRQQRSKEYWDARHNNPDLVSGRDPGLGGLDDYLNNDQYGQNWYSYDGKQFMAEVGADAKARANELLHDPMYENNPELAHIITRLRRTGFTNNEVDTATSLASELIGLSPLDRNAAIEQIKKQDIGTGILTETLLSHLDSTGAYGNVSKSEFDRLINYGRSGLAQGVGEIKYDDFVDPNVAYRQQVALENLRHRHNIELEDYKNRGNKNDNPNGAINTGTTLTVRSAGYDRFANDSSVKSKDSVFETGKKEIFNPDGTTSFAVNSFDATDTVYSTDERNNIQQKFKYDVLNPVEKTMTLKTKSGVNVNIKIGGTVTTQEASQLGIDSQTSIAVRDNNGKLIPALTKDFSNARNKTLAQVNSYKDKNPNLASITYSPEEQARLRKDTGFPDNAPWSDFYDFVTTKYRVGDYTAAPLAIADSAHGYSLSDFNDAMIREYKSAPRDEKTGRTDNRYKAYKVNSDNMTYSQDGEDMGDVLGKDQNGEVRRGTVTDIFATLEDFIQKAPMLRFQSKAKPTETYAADGIVAFGSLVANEFKRRYLPTANGYQYTINGQVPTVSEAIAYAGMPIFNPEYIYSMSYQQRVDWANDMFSLLGQNNYPSIIIGNNEVRPAMPEEILHNKYYQEILYDGIQNAIQNPFLARIRQSLGIEHEQHVGNSSSGAEVNIQSN